MSSKANIIDGKAHAADFRENLRQKISSMPVKPGLAVILVGEDPASQVYVGNKVKACHAAGIESFKHRLPETTTEKQLLDLIDKINDDNNIHGILLQLPLPKHLNSQKAIYRIDPDKDVDGLHPLNIGRLMSAVDGIVPCTPQGTNMLLKTVHTEMSGMHAVVIGRSILFGKPMGQILLQENCTVTQCHSRTRDLPEICAKADIVIAAVGRPQMVKADWVKSGATVIDVGINRLEHPDDPGKTKLVGDVDFDIVKEKAGAITPVPGGVGPMTIACLLANTVKAAEKAD